MLEVLLQLFVLFLVIFDPPASFTVFLAATSNMKDSERKKTAMYAVSVAVILALLVLVFGELLLELFSTSINEFRIAGGIVLAILGLKMALGIPLANVDSLKNDSGRAIASIIGTPLLTGPAAITAIIVSINDFGRPLTGGAVGLVLIFTAALFLLSGRVNRILGKTSIQTISTILGLITLSWGIKYIVVGVTGILV